MSRKTKSPPPDHATTERAARDAAAAEAGGAETADATIAGAQAADAQIADAETAAAKAERRRLERLAQRRAKAAEQRRLRDQYIPALQRFPLRQQRFICEYLALGNASAAARRAGYAERFVRHAGHHLLSRPHVAAVIAAERAAMQQRMEVTMERVIGELAKLAFADPRDLFTDTGKLKPIHELDDASAASIASLEVLAVAGGPRSVAGRAVRAAAPGVPTLRARRKPAADDAAAANAAPDGMDASGGVDTSGGMDTPGDMEIGGTNMVLELRKIRRWDKTKALELLGRYLGLFKDKVELGVSADLATAIEAARKRSRALDAEEVRVIEGEVQRMQDDEG